MSYKDTFYKIVKVLEGNGFDQHAKSIRAQADRNLDESQAQAIVHGIGQAILGPSVGPPSEPYPEPAKATEPAKEAPAPETK